jgi:hypothetical protein
VVAIHQVNSNTGTPKLRLTCVETFARFHKQNHNVRGLCYARTFESSYDASGLVKAASMSVPVLLRFQNGSRRDDVGAMGVRWYHLHIRTGIRGTFPFPLSSGGWCWC